MRNDEKISECHPARLKNGAAIVATTARVAARFILYKIPGIKMSMHRATTATLADLGRAVGMMTMTTIMMTMAAVTGTVEDMVTATTNTTHRPSEHAHLGD